MKKLITIIILLIASVSFSQDTVKKYYKIVDFGKPTQIKYECVVFSNGDTICKEQGKGFSQGYKEQTDTLEVQQELQNVQKLYKETYEQKVKALETSDTDLLRLQGIILYLNEKLNNARKK